jgi:glycosyltransferase involved in cell wall biosynthesis
MRNTLPLASIRCLTYNHEQYIRQCLDGFVMQKTNFPFEIIIHDDASTDKRQRLFVNMPRNILIFMLFWRQKINTLNMMAR